MSGSPSPKPTVLYDAERRELDRADRAAGRRTEPARSPSLAPPDVSAILDSKRTWWRRTMPRSVRVALMCISIAASAVQANGVYCWSTYKHLGLTAAESQTIFVGGILGVYLCAAPIGALTDRLGPRAASFLSALLAFGGYYTFARVIDADTSVGRPDAYLILTVCYFAVGSATVGSYFAALTTASLSFPAYPTLSLSLPLSLIGLSPMFLSAFAPRFTTSHGELNAPGYLTFLAILSFCVNMFGAAFMRVTLPEMPPLDELDASSDDGSDYGASGYYGTMASSIADLSQSLHLDEHTPLLIGGPEAAREEVEAEAQGKEIRIGVLEFLEMPGFWAWGLILTLSVGPAENTLGTIGAVLTSLLPPDDLRALEGVLSGWNLVPVSAFTSAGLASEPTPLALRNKHVILCSISSTIMRLVVGFSADRLAPAPTAIPAPNADPDAEPEHIFVQQKPIILKRSTLCAICTIVLAAVFAWSAAFLDSEPRLWVLSVGVGAMYGAIFTLSPAITSSHFGPTNFGLAWGLVSYFPAVGTAAFGYMYAYFAVTSMPPDTTFGATALEGTCYGPQCFSTTFWISAVCCVVSAVGLAAIGARWRV